MAFLQTSISAKHRGDTGRARLFNRRRYEHASRIEEARSWIGLSLVVAVACFVGATPVLAASPAAPDSRVRHDVQLAANHAARSTTDLARLQALDSPAAHALLALISATGAGTANPAALLASAEAKARAQWDQLGDDVQRDSYPYGTINADLAALDRWAAIDAGTRLARIMRRTLAVLRRVDATDKVGAATAHYPDGDLEDGIWRGWRIDKSDSGDILVDLGTADFSLRIPCRILLDHLPDAVRAFDAGDDAVVRSVIGAPSDCPLPAFAAPAVIALEARASERLEGMPSCDSARGAARKNPENLFALLANLRPLVAVKAMASRPPEPPGEGDSRRWADLAEDVGLWRLAQQQLQDYYRETTTLPPATAEALAAAALDQIVRRPCIFRQGVFPEWPLFALAANEIAPEALDEIGRHLSDADAAKALAYFEDEQRYRSNNRQPFAVADRLVEGHPSLLHDENLVRLLVEQPDYLPAYIMRGIPADTALAAAIRYDAPDVLLGLLKSAAPITDDRLRASLLAQIHDVRAHFSGDHHRASWSEAQRLLGEIVNVPERTPEDRAFAMMVRDADGAEALFRQSDTPAAKIGLAILLKVLRPPGEPHQAEIGALLRDAIAEAPDRSILPPDIEPYDGSFGKLIELVRMASVADVPVGLPCDLLRTVPALAPLVAAGAPYGNRRGNLLPRFKCAFADYPIPAAVKTFFTAVAVPAGYPVYGAQEPDDRSSFSIRVAPWLLLKGAGEDHVPFRAWSLLNLANHRIYVDLERKYLAALRDLTAHYKQNFAMTDADAQTAARNALWSRVYEGHWGPPPQDGLRLMIMDGAPSSAIATFLEQPDSIGEPPKAYLQMDDYEPAWNYVKSPDRLALVTVDRPDVLELILKKGADPSATNDNGKTALMEAAQIAANRSVVLLLGAGVDVNAVSGGFGELKHSLRTALHYAAASGTLDTIKALLAAGADRDWCDSRGRRAVHYLLGQGPTPPNSRLSAAERAEALRALE
jgi:Ankyrin repeats (3 copies)